MAYGAVSVRSSSPSCSNRPDWIARDANQSRALPPHERGMRYRDITCDRFRLPPSHPILAKVAIDPVDWFKFQQMAEDNPATRLISRDDPRDERMVAYVA